MAVQHRASIRPELHGFPCLCGKSRLESTIPDRPQSNNECDWSRRKLGRGKRRSGGSAFPAWGTLSGNNYNAISNYNSLQAQITKRYSNGLLFSANFVWSHMLDDQDSGGWGSRGGTQYWQIVNDPKANYGNSNFDIPIAFKGYASYELPFGRGKRYLNSGQAMDALVGGWRISGTFVAQSGNPFS